MTDWELLRQYREKNSNEAFRKLADRHTKLVYHTCRRDLENAQAAEDATQLVFILLARKARTITRGSSISSWLFTTARFVSKEITRNETRRHRREETAARMEEMTQANREWEELEPQLNDALSTLTSSDREAVLMRYFDGMSLREVAAQIGTTEDTARKRVSRAVERLRGYFHREQAAAALIPLDSLLLANAAGSVPQHTHATVMSTLQHLGAPPAASAALHAHAGLLLKKGVFALMDATVKKLLIAAAIVVLIGAGIAIPVTAGHILYQRLISQDSATLIDATTPSSTLAGSGPDQAVDRAAIMGIIRESLIAYQRRDFAGFVQDAAPGMEIDAGGQPYMSVPQLEAQVQQTFSMMGPFQLTDTIQSLRIHGNSAEVVSSIHFEGTSVKYKNIPPGMKIAQEENEDSTWRKVNGRWITTSVNMLNISTTVNGRVIYHIPGPAQSATARLQ